VNTLEAIIEDSHGNVVGAQTSNGVVNVAHAFPRSELAARARDLAAEFGITIPPPLQAVLPPE
jgi:hypothetical protein